MEIRNKIEQSLEIIRDLEKTLCEVQNKEILPLSFFSSSFDSIHRLKAGIYEIEAMQLQMMQEHIKETESESCEENEINENEAVFESKTPEEKPTPVVNVLADTISRKVSAGFGKSLSLNDRFMFLRDLFHGDAKKMDQAFTQLNTLQSLNEVFDFLNENYSINWDSDSGIVFKELLDKRFA